MIQFDFDAVVIGAGFAGLYALRKLRDEAGLHVRLFEKGSGVGGTWFWNRYPGAMSDTEAPFYRYSFDADLLASDTWTQRYIPQPEILAYLERVAGHFDLMRDIQLNTEVQALHWDEGAGGWHVITDHGRYTARYVVTALGLLSAVNWPNIPGLADFKGILAHTAQWPEGLALDGLRVGVIGTGSTGCQVVCATSRVARHLIVFQRSPQYSVPAGNGPVTPDEVASYRQRWPEVWAQVRSSAVGFGFDESTVSAHSVSDAEREAAFEAAWAQGNGFRFVFGAFCDVSTDRGVNELAAAFIRRKISSIVRDPETARRLTPTGLFAKRPLCTDGYFNAFNQPNVSLVDLRETPIAHVSERGIVTEDEMEHELDVLVLATGFDAVDGNYRRMDIRGRSGTLDAHWDTPSSFLGIGTAGFPNMLMVSGPQGPFANLVPAIEVQVEFIADLIADAEQRRRGGGDAVIDVKPAAEERWTQQCHDLARGTLYAETDSWIFGANIPGKKHNILFYLGGLGKYGEHLWEEEEGGFQGFRHTAPKSLDGVITRVEEVEMQPVQA